MTEESGLREILDGRDFEERDLRLLGEGTKRGQIVTIWRRVRMEWRDGATGVTSTRGFRRRIGVGMRDDEGAR